MSNHVPGSLFIHLSSPQGGEEMTHSGVGGPPSLKNIAALN